MSIRKALSPMALTLGLAATMAPALAQESLEENSIGRSGPWDIMTVGGGDVVLYCSADRDNGRVQLRIARDEKGWMIGMPYYNTGKAKGAWSLGGSKGAATFVSEDGSWAFMRVPDSMRKAMLGQKTITLQLDRGAQTFKIDGLKAAMAKVDGCVADNLQRQDDYANASEPAQPASQPRQTKAGPTPDGFYLKPYFQGQGWQVVKYLFEKNKPDFQSCDASKIDHNGVGVRLGYNKYYFNYGFQAPDLMNGANEAKLRYWFDNNKKSGKSEVVPLMVDHDGSQWYSFQASNSEDTSQLDGFLNAQSVTFVFTANGQQLVETFDLDGVRLGLGKALECSDG